MMKSKLSYGLVIALCLTASSAWTDSLELKNGSLIKGKFLGGTESEISFQVRRFRSTTSLTSFP